MTRAEHLQHISSTIFRRRGENGVYTRLFEDLFPVHREFLLSNVPLHEGELPVIGSVDVRNSG